MFGGHTPGVFQEASGVLMLRYDADAGTLELYHDGVRVGLLDSRLCGEYRFVVLGSERPTGGVQMLCGAAADAYFMRVTDSRAL